MTSLSGRILSQRNPIKKFTGPWSHRYLSQVGRIDGWDAGALTNHSLCKPTPHMVMKWPCGSGGAIA